MADYSIQEVAEVSGISVRSLRNYLRHYRDYLRPGRGACNALVFEDEDVRTFLKIRTLLREGRSREEIQSLLGEGSTGGEMVIRRSDEPALPPGLETLSSQLQLQSQLMERLLEENVALRKRLEGLERRLATPPDGLAAAPLQLPRQIPVRRRGTVSIRVPWFLLRMSDGARALAMGVAAALFPRRPGAGQGPG